MMVPVHREAPFPVLLAWACLDRHHHKRCSRCAEADLCPAVGEARARIKEWRKARALLGWTR
ncbi:hypothetical protein [Micromonospora sp. NPDC092111]|uniref:hypothetical protein n=1 Tax=Micromonospora sp. NPDC092111 TaxID=3364289 RepID=UPI0037F7979C